MWIRKENTKTGEWTSDCFAKYLGCALSRFPFLLKCRNVELVSVARVTGVIFPFATRERVGFAAKLDRVSTEDVQGRSRSVSHGPAASLDNAFVKHLVAQPCLAPGLVAAE